ncbi:hypothetical protein NKG05_19850 [Oerskovia sp. M15]
MGAVAQEAPGIVHWQPWNEPNNTGFDDGAQYQEQIGAPSRWALALRSPVS